MRSENTINSVQIFNLNGRLEKVKQVYSTEFSINVSKLNSGLYYIVFKVGDSIQSYKFIKK